ncbi:VC0807 family protein [Gandjariella thermophila]|nr:VC0807 family protein [Gandjariella thermophila]
MAQDDGPGDAGEHEVSGAAPAGQRPAVSFAATVLLAVLLPYGTYRLLLDYDFESVDALVLAAVFPVGLATVDLALRRRPDPLTGLSVLTIALGIAAGELTVDPRLALARYSLFSGGFAVVLLGSLAVGRPLAFVLCRTFVARHDPEIERVWLNRWRGCPALRATLRRITAAWSVLLLADAAARVAVAYTLPVTRATTVSHLAAVLAVALLLAVTAGYLRRGLPAIRWEFAEQDRA